VLTAAEDDDDGSLCADYARHFEEAEALPGLLTARVPPTADEALGKRWWSLLDRHDPCSGRVGSSRDGHEEDHNVQKHDKSRHRVGAPFSDAERPGGER